MFFRRFVDKNWIMVFPLLLLMVSLLPIWFMVGHTAAFLVSSFGTFFIMASVVLYIVFSYSKRRWPNEPWYRRATLYLTFKR